MNNIEDMFTKYDCEVDEYFKDLSKESFDMLLKIRGSECFMDVRFIIDKYEEFIHYLITYCNDKDMDNLKLHDQVNELRNILECRERDLMIVKRERNALSRAMFNG